MQHLRAFTLFIIALPFTAAFALTVNLIPTNPTCSYPSGMIVAYASGGTQPYSYQWSTGATTQAITGLLAGVYSVIVTDALADEQTVEVELIATPYELMSTTSGLPWCSAPNHAFEDPMVSGLPNNWTVAGFPAESSGWIPDHIRFPSSPFDTWFVYDVDDGNGCTGTVSGSNGEQISDWPQINVVTVEPSCGNGAFGAIHVEVDGGFPSGLQYPPYIALLDDGGINPTLVIAPDQNGVGSLSGLVSGTYGLRWWIGVTAEAMGGPCSYDTVWVVVPDAGEICGALVGSSFVDVDEDCVRDPGEYGIPYSPLLIQPGDETVLTDQNGNFNIPLLNGSYTVAQQDPQLELLCPTTQPIPFTISPGQTELDLANSNTGPLDLQASVSSGVFRPGFQTYYTLNVRNLSTEGSGDATVTLTLDQVLSPVDIQPAPSAIDGNVITWDVPPIGPYANFNAYVRVQVPIPTPLGSMLNTSLAVTNTLADADPTNDVDVALDEVVGSYDPNDKRATTSTRTSDDLYFINEDEWIDYTIRFQNTGTYYAEFVVITDTLPATLDMLTFEQGVASHPFTVSFKPGRIVEWRFENIFLPDSTTAEPGSHGLVKFRIAPRAPLTPGTAIENIANIYFDFNEPVITEPSVLVAEFSTNVQVPAPALRMNLMPNPTNDVVIIQLDGMHTNMGNLRVLSVDGRNILQQATNTDRVLVDLTPFNSGAYFMEWIDGSGIRIVEPIIRN